MKTSTLRARASLLRTIRQYFYQSKVMEVTTPVCSQAAGPDPAIEPLSTRYQGPEYPRGKTLFLQTSPEFPMKRLLALGSGSIYQICQVFRDGELGRLHNPEFTLLEWYRTGIDHHGLMDEVATLAGLCLEQEFPLEKISYRELFQRLFQLDPLEAGVPALVKAASTAGIAGVDGLQLSGRDAWLDLLMSHVVEPTLGRNTLTFIYDYPASQASLARLNPLDKRVACRFELYFQGVELANGFHELTNAAEQRLRFQADNQLRESQGQKVLPVDENFLSALDLGLPDCAGVAVGIDRLLMLKLGASSLAEVIPFTLPRA